MPAAKKTLRAMKKTPQNAPAFVNRNLPLLLLQARESVIRRFRPVLNANGVTEQQWRIIRVLAERGPTEPRDLVRLCSLSSPSLTGILARLVDLKLIARESVPSDQRRILVSLTPKCRGLAARVMPEVDAIYAELQADLGKEFKEELYGILDRLIEILDGEGEPADE